MGVGIGHYAMRSPSICARRAASDAARNRSSWSSGIQQALDLLSRLLLKQNDPVWMEDPGYFGATVAFGSVGARIIPVPVDEEGLSVSAGTNLVRGPRRGST